jgi:capsular exopolysaccharide synthesis family protein
MDFRDISKIVLKYKFIIVMCMAVVLGVAMLFTKRNPTRYTAQSRIAVKTQSKIYAGYDEYSELSMLSAFDNYRNVQTQAEMLKSKKIQSLAHKSLGLSDDEIRSLLVKVNPEQDSDLLRIEVTSVHRDLAINYANELADQYVRYTLNSFKQEAEERADYFQGKLLDVEKELRQAQIEREIYKKEHIAGSFESEAAQTAQSIYDYERMLNAAQIDQEANKQRIAQTMRELSSEAPLETRTIYTANALRKELQGRQASLEIDLAKARQLYGDRHPDVQSLERQIETVKNKLVEDEYNDLRVVLQEVDEANPVHRELLKNLADLRVEQGAVEDKVAILSGLVEESRKPLETLPEKEKTLEQFDIRINMLKEEQSTLQKKFKDFQLSSQVPTTVGEITDRALGAYDTQRSHKALTLLIAALGGLLMGLIIAFIREYLDDTLYTARDVEEALTLSVLGQIPLEKNIGTDPRVCADKPNTPVAESFRALRNRLKYILAEQDMRMFLITSSAVQEGKSFVSLNLAITMAQYGHKVLLVDADMRRPTLHRSFDVPNNGISNVIIDGDDVTQYILETEIPNLSILPAGPLPLAETTPVVSSEIFEDPRIRDMFSLLRISYDYVILDTPPILAVTDVMALTSMVPGVLFVVSAGDMQRADVVSAKNMIESTGVKMLGAVLNRAQHSVSYYRYLYYYYDKDSSNRKHRVAGR